jgi:hypothetical protein
MTSSRMTRGSLLLALLVLGSSATSRATTTDQFTLRSGADLVALCSTPAADPLYTAAIHMCHGFGAGTYQTILAMTRHEKLTPIFCPPEPPIARNEAVGLFLEWAKVNPQYLSERPVDVVARFLIQRFPCGSK